MFSQCRTLISGGDRLRANLDLRALHSWAGLPAAQPVSGATSMQRRGTNLHARRGEMHAEVRSRLGAFFAPFNRALPQLLRRHGCVDHLGTEFAWVDGWL